MSADDAYPPGTLVRARVTRQEQFGVFVELPGTTLRALIRRTDIDPAGASVASEDMPRVGELLDAIVVGVSGEQQIVLSRRLEHYAQFGQ